MQAQNHLLHHTTDVGSFLMFLILPHPPNEWLFHFLSLSYFQFVHSSVASRCLFIMGEAGKTPLVYGAALEDLIKLKFKVKSKSKVLMQIQEQDTLGDGGLFGKCAAKAKYTRNPHEKKIDSHGKHLFTRENNTCFKGRNGTGSPPPRNHMEKGWNIQREQIQGTHFMGTLAGLSYHTASYFLGGKAESTDNFINHQPSTSSSSSSSHLEPSSDEYEVCLSILGKRQTSVLIVSMQDPVWVAVSDSALGPGMMSTRREEGK